MHNKRRLARIQRLSYHDPRNDEIREVFKGTRELLNDSRTCSSLTEASLDANHPVFSHDALTSTRKELEKERNLPADRMSRTPERKDRKKQHGISLTTTGSESSCKHPPDASSCMLCKGKHGLAACKNFTEKPFKERLELCMSRGICFSCLSQGHTARQCKQKTQCEVCKKPHATALHRFSPEEKRQESTEETVRATNNCVNCSNTTSSMILTPCWMIRVIPVLSPMT